MENEVVTKTKERDCFFDNLKAIFIFLVVLGHFIGPLGKIYGIKFLYRYIYLFHMPGMILISGYFFKKSVENGKLIKNKVFNYMLIYIIFQVIYTVINESKFSLYQAQMGLWYIQLLIIYNFLIPVISRIKAKYCLILCLLLGLIVGLDNSAGHVASLSRALVFLPFFMIGFYLKRQHLEKLFEKKYICIGIIMLIIIGIILFLNINNWTQLLNISSGKLSYKAMKLDYAYGIIYRLVWYVVAMLALISIIAITPKKKCWFTYIGMKTLQIFLLHLIICVLLRKTDIYKIICNYNDYLVIFISIISSALITYITSLKIFSYPFDYLMKIKFRWLLKEEKN